MKLSDLDLDLRLPKPPMVLVAVLVIGMFLPMGVASAVWFKRNTFDPHPRIHIFQDMDNQAKSKAQSSSEVFADGRSMRAPVPGTVAFSRNAHRPDPDMLKDDDLAYRGYEVSPETGETVYVEGAEGGDPQPKYLAGYPQTIEVTAEFIRRGQSQFMIHCYTCHGADGRGMGPTKLEMDRLAIYDASVPDEKKTGTVATIPANLTDPKFVEATYINGRLYNTITKGQGTMGPVGLQMKVKDRWAVVAYVRALQKAQAGNAPPPHPPAE